ncbi:MAG: hypothetical protein ACLS3C_07620 [Oscillospiraceae bacterium]
MLISSMGRYAVLILLDLAEHRGGFVPRAADRRAAGAVAEVS